MYELTETDNRNSSPEFVGYQRRRFMSGRFQIPFGERDSQRDSCHTPLGALTIEGELPLTYDLTLLERRPDWHHQPGLFVIRLTLDLDKLLVLEGVYSAH